MNLQEWAEKERGNISRLAKDIGRSYADVHPMVFGKRRIPEELCPKVAIVTGVPLHILRADVDWPTKLNELRLAIRVS